MDRSRQGDSRHNTLLVDSSEVELELYFSCRKLADLDFISVTDSFVVGFVKEGNAEYKKVYETKVYNNDLNPDYYETLVLPFLFDSTPCLRSAPQLLTLEVYHKENPRKLVGKASVKMDHLYNNKSKTTVLDLLDLRKQKRGQILIRTKQLSKMNSTKVTFDLHVIGLPKAGCSCYLIDCCQLKYFVRLKKQSGGETILVYESNQTLESQDIVFQRIVMSEEKLCNCNQNMPLVCQVWEYAENGSHKIIGKCESTLNQIMQKSQINLIDGGKKLKTVMVFDKPVREQAYTLEMFLQKGTKFRLSIYVDFTSSNKQATDPDSYHYGNNQKPSHYEKAIRAVTSALMSNFKENFDQRIGLWGFGAQVNMPNLKSNGKEHQCFPLNDSDGYVQGIEELVAVYRQSIHYLKFGRKTYFSNFLQKAKEITENFRGLGPKDYLIALVLTDGGLQDLQKTQDILVKCGRLPISVIMVGIGTGQFGYLERLDDNYMTMTDQQGNKTERDLVTFVNFEKSGYDEKELVKEVTKELARQFLDYCKLVKKAPKHVGKRSTTGIWSTRRVE